MGESIGQYELLGVLGSGGFGTVHRARDTRIGRTVAVRVIGDVAGAAERHRVFLEDVRPFLQVSHPNVATLFDVGQHHGLPFLVYEFVPGESLAQLAAGRALGLRRVLDLCTQAADGLAEIHALGLAHGQLTPSSLVVTTKGHLKILDLGLSRWQPGGPGRQTAVRLDERGATLGPASVGYMAPEQVLGDVADHRADIFALGTVAYQLLTGKNPFESARPSDTALRITQYLPPAPGAVVRGLPPEVDRAIQKAMSKSLSDRYDSAATFAADLRAATAALHEREARAEAEPAASARAAARAPIWRTLFLLVLLVAAAGVAGWAWRDWIARAWNGRAGRELQPVVAVAPFVEHGSLPRVNVGAGLAAEVARRLGQVPGLEVRGSTSVHGLANQPPTGVANLTGAATVVTGVVNPGRDGWPTFEVVAELADGTTGRSAWRSRYDGTGNELASVPARIARDVVARLGLAGASSPSNARAVMRLVASPAYEAYLRGLEAAADGDTARASQQFEAAVAGDPGLVEAQAALAESLHNGAVFEGRGDYGAVRARARRIAEEAATADPDLSAAHLALGLTADTYGEAVGQFRTAVSIDASNVRAWLAFADVLRDIDPARATTYARRAASLDPVQPLSAYHEAAAALQLGDRPSALAVIARGQAASPASPWWDALRQRALLIGPETAPAIAPARSVTDFAPAALIRGVALVREGKPGDAAEMLAIVTRMNPDSCEARALLAAVRRAAGQRSEAAQLAADILAPASRAADQAPWVRCAAMAAAGVGDAQSAANWLTRAADDPRALRLMNATSAVLSPMPSIRQSLFPWDSVAAHPAVRAAVGRIEDALARLRTAARAE